MRARARNGRALRSRSTKGPNFHLDFVDVGVDCTDNFFRKTAIEKAILRILRQARFHTAWVKNGSVRARAARPFYPQEQTQSACPSMSVWCHKRSSATSRQTA